MNEKEQGGYRIHDPHGTYFVTFTIVGWVDVFTRKVRKKDMWQSKLAWPKTQFSDERLS